MTNLKIYEDQQGIDVFPQGTKFRISFNSELRKFRILCLNSNDLNGIRDAFSAPNPSAYFMKQHGCHVESTVCVINTFGYFAPGLIFEILKYIKLNYLNLSVVAMSKNCKMYIEDYLMPLKRIVSGMNPDSFTVRNICDDSGRNERFEKSDPSKIRKLRPYQSEVIQRLIFNGFGHGLFEEPTSAGKTLIIANIIHNIDMQIMSGLKYLIFVPSISLVNQFYDDLLDYGFDSKDVTRLCASIKKKDGCFDPNAKIIIANRQTLYTKANLLPKIDVFINDEVHQSADPKSTTASFVEKLDCRMKIGCSGTLKRDLLGKWTLTGLFGNLVHREEITNLQQQGYISKLHIDVIKIKDMNVENNRDYLFNTNPRLRYDPTNPNGITFNQAYESELDYINKHYYDLYSPILNELQSISGNILVLFDRIEFGRNMFNLACELKVRNADFHYIDGSTPVADRDRIRKDLEKSSNNILFGNVSIIGTGVSINNLNCVVFMFSSKSTSRTIQSIGRVLRLHRDKDYAQLIDCVFNFKYSTRHYRERLAMYKEFYHKERPDRVKEVRI